MTLEDKSAELAVCVAVGHSVGTWFLSQAEPNDGAGSAGSATAVKVYQDPRHLDLGIRSIVPAAKAAEYHANESSWAMISETVCVCVCVTHTNTQTHMYIHTCIYIYIYMCVCVCVRVCVCVCVCV